MGIPAVKSELKKIQGLEKQLESVKKEIEAIQKEQAEVGDKRGKDIKALTGTFGLRVLKPVLKG